MKNLHLMSMDSFFDDSMVAVFNQEFPINDNVFFHRTLRKALESVENSFVVPEAFTAEYINEHAHEYKRIILHSLFLGENGVLKLSDEAASKIVWVVWGHDLYSVHKKKKWTVPLLLKEAVHTAKKILRGTYIRAYKAKKEVARKVALFQCIGIGFPYDEKMIRKKYGHKPRVVYGPVFGPKTPDNRRLELRERHLAASNHCTHVIIGHSGFEFLEHEKYLNKLSKYKNEDMHIYLVLSYGADEERIQKLTTLANQLFHEGQVTIITEMMDKEEYRAFLSKMDVAVFPFLHQSALSNTQMMAFMGTKMYFDPRGVLAKGFQAGGVKSYDCRKIGKIPFSIFKDYNEVPPVDAPLFSKDNYDNAVKAWQEILQ